MLLQKFAHGLEMPALSEWVECGFFDLERLKWVGGKRKEKMSLMHF